MSGNDGDGNPATSAKLNNPRGIAVHPGSGTIYIVDQNNNNVRQVIAGIISTLAGAGGPGDFQDGPASAAKFNLPTGIAVDPVTGDVYVADVFNSRIRRILRWAGHDLRGYGQVVRYPPAQSQRG